MCLNLGVIDFSTAHVKKQKLRFVELIDSVAAQIEVIVVKLTLLLSTR